MSASSISIFCPWRALKRQAAPQFWPESDDRERHESSNSSGSISDVIESQQWHHRQPSAAETPPCHRPRTQYLAVTFTRAT